MSFRDLKKRALERFFGGINDRQKEAVFRTKGAVLIIAGAGSGKTTVLCSRTANLILFGDSYNTDFDRELSAEDSTYLQDYVNGDAEADNERLSTLLGFERVAPWRILAVTFTNKAAAELKSRLYAMNINAGDIWAGTFHSTCVKLLRRGIEKIGYKSNFTIYDSDDCLRVIKACLAELNMSDKSWNPKKIQSDISRAKDKLLPPEKFETYLDGKQDYALEKTKAVYEEYQKRLKAAGALDFDDLIMKTIELLNSAPEILEKWRRQFEYIMVDEYQDTNHAQYKLISLLAGGAGNLCVVGDEDQSIYRFRGATIENILSFEDEFKAHTIKLEQNYRSTETILEAANAVIKNNTSRKDKTLWSNLGVGEKIDVKTFLSEKREASFIADTIQSGVLQGKKYSDFLVLYRMNAQSRTVELSLAASGIPYGIIGGVRFYERKEIKDVLAYLSVIQNPDDIVRLRRIINVPKRGIGDSTQAEVGNIAFGLGLSPVEVMERAAEFGTLSKRTKQLTALAAIFRELGASENERYLPDLIDDVLLQSGYLDMLKNEGTEGEMRLQNIRELKSAAVSFCEENPESGLSEFLEQAALIADMDSYEQGEDKCVLMTMHSAKGLEFDTVFIVGAEENIFPSYRSAFDPKEIEEERRLAYVAITRAKKKLYVLCAKERLFFGQTQRNKLSRFIREIPPSLMTVEKEESPVYVKPTQKKEVYVPISGFDRKKTAPSTPQNFSDGERIRHNIFGEGTVIDVNPMGGDLLLEIIFDKVGTKKLMANFAKIEKIGD
ncbi:MAG: UvrD-helicase domain-containing protein [Oscillospiraceae bacterium]|nr:UvrD-helicase domain-containing protein [Oscillospiraceae bacterium]